MALGAFHSWVTKIALEGRLNGDFLKKTIAHSGWRPDIHLGHGNGVGHRLTVFQEEFERYGGKYCPFPGAEAQAAIFIEEARQNFLAEKQLEVGKPLGYALHFVQDALCPEHIFPVQESRWQILFLREPHFNIMMHMWRCRKSWISVIKEASPRLILSSKELKRELEEKGQIIRSLDCSYRREDGYNLGKVPWWGWDISDDNFKIIIEYMASLTKGAVDFVLRIE